MKFDEWGLRKYKVSRKPKISPAPSERQENTEEDNSPQLHEQVIDHEAFNPNAGKPSKDSRSFEAIQLPSSISVDEDVQEDYLTFGPVKIPSRSLKADELLPLIRCRDASPYAIEILLTKWQARDDYIAALKSFLPLECPVSWVRWGVSVNHIFAITPRKLFDLVQKHVPRDQHIELIKAFIQGGLLDYDNYHEALAHDSDLEEAWYDACLATNWTDVKQTLAEAGEGMNKTRKLYLRIALMIIADHLLREHKNRLERLREKMRLLLDHESQEAAHRRQQYLEILRDMSGTKLEPRPSWYKYALQVSEWNESCSGESQRPVEEETSQLLTKYQKVIGSCFNIREEQVQSEIDALLRKVTGEEISRNLNPGIALTIREPFHA
jgi:hypothetical protein